MALSYFTESEAPRDFRISSTESESHYTKCLLCYTIKKNFYCVDCIRNGNFIHSSMPYSDRYAERQAKLLRLKANRKHVQDRCEALLLSKSRHSNLQMELKQCKDRVEIIKLAIEQRKQNIVERKQELVALIQYNKEVADKLPRYEKRVSSLARHAEQQAAAAAARGAAARAGADELAALRRARIRQLTQYIFPVYLTYDSSDSIEDMEFLQVEDSTPSTEEEENEEDRGGEGGRERLHIVSAWLPADGDPDVMRQALSSDPESNSAPGSTSSSSSGAALAAALALGAQLAALLGWLLDARLPDAIDLHPARLTPTTAEARFRALCGACVALSAASGRPAPPRARRAARLLPALLADAYTDQSQLGRPYSPVSASAAAAAEAWAARWPPPPPRADDPPEHLSWPADAADQEYEDPPPPASLVTSAAASLASMWRGWTK